MALLALDGFDHNSNNSRPGATYNLAYGAGRFGGLACRNSTSDTSYVRAFTPVTGVFTMGFATRWTSGFTPVVAALAPIRFENGATTHLTLRASSTDGWEVVRGSSTIIASSASALMVPNVWYYTEIAVRIADTGGTVVVRLNGVEVINFTGDTRNAGVAQVDQITCFFPASNTTQWIDDVYYLDDTGPAPYNTFLGDCRVPILAPNGNGTYSQLVGSDGNSTDNYQLVDEIPPSTADYVGSATPGQRDTYQHTDLTTAAGQVLAVQPAALAFASDAGAASLKTVTRLASGTERLSAAQTLSASAQWICDPPQTTDPAGVPWTITNVNNAEFGVEVA